MSSWLEMQRLWCEPRAIGAHGTPAEKILEVAENTQADLIAQGVRNFKGVVRATHLPIAVAHQVISHATCPVLTIRPLGRFTRQDGISSTDG